MDVRITRILSLILLVAGTARAAPIYRCIDAGTVTYQEQACASAGERVAIPDTYPEVNRAERDRLLQREAALEARLLKRAEIESAERIARENRRAREIELAAERERAQPAEPVYVVPVIARPHRPVRPHRYGAFRPGY